LKLNADKTELLWIPASSWRNWLQCIPHLQSDHAQWNPQIVLTSRCFHLTRLDSQTTHIQSLCQLFLSAATLGTPFPGPPFLQSGVPRPQTAFFSWECTFSGCVLSIAVACATVRLNTCSPQSMHTSHAIATGLAGRHVVCSMLSLIIDWQQQLALCYHSQYARLSHTMATFQSNIIRNINTVLERKIFSCHEYVT